MLTKLKSLSSSLAKLTLFRVMSTGTFVQKLNCLTNKMEWQCVDENYDYHQEISRAAYADMLHDDERNKMFASALKEAINITKSKGRKAKVLDIGTGTGLLSMLAVRYGADSVTACEAFLPMANCAQQVMKENNIDSINLVRKHSTEVTVGENGDMKEKANILVAEVFDTELIGEGAIRTFNHAHNYLLEEDSIVIPSSGTVYAQVVECDLSVKWNSLQPCYGDTLLNVPEEFVKCPGAASVHDIQLTMLPNSRFTILSHPCPVFKFNWSGKNIPVKRTTVHKFKCLSDGKTQAVFMWWDLIMDTAGNIVMSCAPVWSHYLTKMLRPEFDEFEMDARRLRLPWRDHWIQAVYHLPGQETVTRHETVFLQSNHDEYSMWFDVKRLESSFKNNNRPVCECGLHLMLSRTRLGAVNDTSKQTKFVNLLRKQNLKNSLVVILDDLSFLSVVVCKLGAKHVFTSADKLNKTILNNFINYNHVRDRVTFYPDITILVDLICQYFKNNSAEDIIIFSEPYFSSSFLSLTNLRCWILKCEVMKCLNSKKIQFGTSFIEDINNKIKLMPKCANLYCVAVSFDDLWKIRAPVVTCEGFKMSSFDKLIKNSSEQADSQIEPQPLWEYPCKALANKIKLKHFDFVQDFDDDDFIFDVSDEIKCERDDFFDGFVFWVEFDFGYGETMSSGPKHDVVTGSYIHWDIHQKQDVHLFTERKFGRIGDVFKLNIKFNIKDSVFSIDADC